MSPAEFVAWAPGRLDGLGRPFSAWLLAVEGPDGRPLRDEHGHQVFETQAQWLARQTAPITTPAAAPVQQDLFA